MSSAVVVDLEVDFHNEDETGYVWTWLSELVPLRDHPRAHRGGR